MFAPQQNNQQPDCMTTVMNWWNEVPFGTKFLFVSTSVLYILDFPLNGVITYILADIPYYTLQGYIWRLLLTEFVHGQLINLLFSLLSIYATAIQLEKTIGSINFIIDVLLKNIIIQVFYVFFVYILSFIFGSNILTIPSYGLWNLVITYITLRSFSNPEEDTQFLCFPVMIKNKYYPLAIVILVNLFAFPKIDFVAAVALGYVEYKFFNGMMYRPSRETIDRYSNNFIFSNFKNRPDFVSYDGILNNDGGFQARPVNNQQQIKEFGGKGVKIGGESFGGINSNQVYVYPQALQEQQISFEMENKGFGDNNEIQTTDQQNFQAIQESNEDQKQLNKQQKQKKQDYNALGEDLV